MVPIPELWNKQDNPFPLFIFSLIAFMGIFAIHLTNRKLIQMIFHYLLWAFV